MPKILSVKKVLQDSPFLKHNLIFFFGSLAVSALNYLYYPVLGRMLEPKYFGEVQALMTLYMQAAIFLNILTYITVHVTVNSRDPDQRNQILLGLERVALFMGYGLLLLALLLTPLLKSFLHFEEGWSFVAMIFTLALSVPLAFRMAFLRGSKLFAKSSIADGTGSLAKLIISPLLVFAGWKTFGAVVGLALSQLFSLWLAVGWARQAGLTGFGLTAGRVSLKRLKPQLVYGLAVFLASSSVVALLSLDILTIKHYFPAEQAGQYAGIATVARIVYFFTAPFTAVLLTSVSVRQSESKNWLQLKGCLGLIASLGGAVVLFMRLFPEFTISVLVGPKYLEYSSYLPWLGLALLLLAIANALLMYRIALRQYSYIIAPLEALAVTLVLLYFRHATISDVINVVLVGGFLMNLTILGHGFGKKLKFAEARG